MDLDIRTRTSLMLLCQQFHERVAAGGREFLAEAGRHTYVTPTSYLELLAAFRSLQEAKRAENARLRKRCAGCGRPSDKGLPHTDAVITSHHAVTSALCQAMRCSDRKRHQCMRTLDVAFGLPWLIDGPPVGCRTSQLSQHTPAVLPPVHCWSWHAIDAHCILLVPSHHHQLYLTPSLLTPSFTHHRYLTGLEKLASSAEQVAGMKAELVALQPQLGTTVADVEALMAKVAREKAEVVEPQAAAVKEEEAKAQGAADAAKAIKDECEADLAVVGGGGDQGGV